MTRYISLIITTRNDNYGGNLLYRLELFLNTQLEMWQRYNLDGELIIVEWNPPLNHPRLIDELDWTIWRRLNIRIIEVPTKLHNSFLNSDRIPLHEFIGKNVGIRRAHGDFLLATNADLLYTPKLIEFLARRRLQTNCFYRVDRYDVNAIVPLEFSLEEQLAFCERHVLRVNARGGTVNLLRPLHGVGRLTSHVQLSVHRAISLVRNGIWDRLHSNASGDFLLMARSEWHTLHGFPEFPTVSHMDSYMCAMAASKGLRQVLLSKEMRIYHQEHERAVDWRNLLKTTRPMTNYELLVKHSEEMIRAKKPIIFNDENWGLGNHSLKEIRVD